MFQLNKVKMFFIIIFIAFELSCNVDKGMRYNFDYKPRFVAYNGFIVTNSNGEIFYKIEDKYLQDYVKKNLNDSLIIYNLLKKTQIIYPLSGSSVEYFAWRKFFYRLQEENRLIRLTIDNCSGSIKSLAIPVFLVSCNIIPDDFEKISKCNKFLNKSLMDSHKLGVVYIMPLDSKLASEFQNMRDSISLQSPEYQEFLKFRYE